MAKIISTEFDENIFIMLRQYFDSVKYNLLLSKFVRLRKKQLKLLLSEKDKSQFKLYALWTQTKANEKTSIKFLNELRPSKVKKLNFSASKNNSQRLDESIKKIEEYSITFGEVNNDLKVPNVEKQYLRLTLKHCNVKEHNLQI